VKKANNSLGVAISWDDDKTRTARLKKHQVTVSVNHGMPVRYKSTGKAFVALLPPMPTSRHIAFRQVLKAQGVARYWHEGQTYDFALIEA
jgi:hypothetical protein